MAAGLVFCWKAVCLLKPTCLLHAWRLLTLGLLMSNWFAQGEELVLSRPMCWLKAQGLLEAYSLLKATRLLNAWRLLKPIEPLKATFRRRPNSLLKPNWFAQGPYICMSGTLGIFGFEDPLIQVKRSGPKLGLDVATPVWRCTFSTPLYRPEMAEALDPRIPQNERSPKTQN